MLSVIMLNVIMLNVIMLNFDMLNVVMLNVVMLNVIMLNVIMLNVDMLNVILLNVVMLNVVLLNVVILNVVMLIVTAPHLSLRRPMGQGKTTFLLPFHRRESFNLCQCKHHLIGHIFFQQKNAIQFSSFTATACFSSLFFQLKKLERILKTSSEAVFLVVYDPSMNELRAT